MLKGRHVLVFPACEALAMPSARAADAMDPQLRRRTVRAIAGGLHYLRGQQAADGSVLKSVGITAVSLRAFLESPENYNESEGAFITRPLEYLLANVKGDGSISRSLQATAYNTAVALNAFAATKNPKYDAVIAAARKKHNWRNELAQKLLNLQAGPTPIRTRGWKTGRNSSRPGP